MSRKKGSLWENDRAILEGSEKQGILKSMLLVSKNEVCQRQRESLLEMMGIITRGQVRKTVNEKRELHYKGRGRKSSADGMQEMVKNEGFVTFWLNRFRKPVRQYRELVTCK